MKCKPLLAALLLAAPAVGAGHEGDDHLYWFSAAQDDKPRPWAVILPGGGGIDIFGDEGAYYFAFAEMLNNRGIDALVVHYQEDTPPMGDVGIAGYGAEIAGAADRGVAHQRGLRRMDMRCDGLVFAWSMGGEGLLTMAKRDSMALPGLRSAIAYYPSVQGQAAGGELTIGTTIFQGDADQLTPLAALNAHLDTLEVGEYVTVHEFRDAQHGFDITTLEEPVLEGRFAHDPASAAEAAELLDTTLAEIDPGCALD